MPTIFQLPPLDREPLESPSAAASEGRQYKDGEGLRLSSNGAPSAAARPSPADAEIDQRLHVNPFNLLENEFDTESERLRRREAAWISLAVHGAILLFILFALPKLMARSSHNNLSVAEMLQQHDLTYLELPPAPEVKPPKQTNKISEQDRVATTRRPMPDQKTLKELRDAARAEAARAQSAAMAAQQPAPAAQASQPATPPERANDSAALQSPAKPQAKNTFTARVSPGSAIEQALRASAADNRTYSGSPGAYGNAPSTQITKLGQVDVLSDTMGVDFGPYLSRVLNDIRRNWYNLIPEEARPPLMKQGEVLIQFAILKNGAVAGLRQDSSSGDIALDRAAWGGITGSNPFQPLPQQFRGQYLALRLHFFYNPDKGMLR